MIFKGYNLRGEDIHTDANGAREVSKNGVHIASIASCSEFDPYGEFSDTRYITVIESIERACRQIEGRGIAAIGVNAALREMSKYWDSHLMEGHPPKIVVTDLRDAIKCMSEMIAELVVNFAQYADVPSTEHAVYLHNLNQYAKPGTQSISDLRLASALQHTKINSQTCLMVTAIGGQTYSLQLAGYVDCGEVTPPIEVLEMQPEDRPVPYADLEVEAGPWFEWVDVDGNPVGDVFDEISLDPKVEIYRLTSLLVQSA